MKFPYMFILFLATLMSVSAYNVSDIVHYYDFETATNYTAYNLTIYDMIGNNDFIGFKSLGGNINSFVYTSTGLQGNGLKQEKCWNNLCDIVSTPYTELDENMSWSINVWYYKYQSPYAFYPFIWIRSDKNLNDSVTEYVNYMRFQDGFHGHRGTYLNSTNSSLINFANSVSNYAIDDEWFMATWIYDNVTENITIYVNGGIYLMNEVANKTTLSTYTELAIGSQYVLMDEMSVWKTKLDTADLQTLFNNRFGLSFSETIIAENDTTYTENITHQYNRCLLSSNTSAYLCADVVITYNPYTTSCSAGNITPCGDTACNDNYDYYLSLGYSPPFNDYNGSCLTCNNSCNTNLQLTCYNEYISQICRLDANTGCYYLQTYEVCGVGQKCSGGYCSYAGNSTSLTGDSRDDFLTGSGLSKGTKYLIVFFVMIMLIGVFVGIGFYTGTEKMSTILGVVMSVFALIIFTTFGWIPSYIFIMLIIIALASVIFIGFAGRNNGSG